MRTEGASVSAVRRAVDSGIFVVAAAGNDGGGSDDGLVSVPGNVPRVITVGASTQEQTVWVNSSAGSQVMPDGTLRQNPHLKPEVIAPGVGIISTGLGDSWYSSSGTSDSTVFVTGALSLLLEAFPEYKPTSDHPTVTVLTSSNSSSEEFLAEVRGSASHTMTIGDTANFKPWIGTLIWLFRFLPAKFESFHEPWIFLLKALLRLVSLSFLNSQIDIITFL